MLKREVIGERIWGPRCQGLWDRTVLTIEDLVFSVMVFKGGTPARP